MTWTKIDDQFHAHPKVQAAWHANPAAIGLHVLALSHAGAYLTDGHVSEAFVRTQIATLARRRRVVGALLDAGLWEPTSTGLLIHDYLDFNEPRERVLARREESLARGRGGARVRGGARGRGPTPTPYPAPLAS